MARASWYRHVNPPVPAADPVAQKDRFQPAALTNGERAQIRGYLADERWADLSVSQTVYRLLDDGVYIASLSTWHRIAREHELSGDRRRLATHPSRAIPELCADGPGQVWSWDITTLKSIDRGRNFKLYVVMDVFSRAVVAWRLEDDEDGQKAKRMFQDAITRQGHAPLVLHADRGAPMTGRVMTGFLKTNNIIQSHSRPRVSNDNPFSESQFKTMKYCQAYPGKFDDLAHARAWYAGYVEAYNTDHRHSGIGYYTPASVHDGTWTVVRDRRQAVLAQAFERHPERFVERPRPYDVEEETWINDPEKRREKQVQEAQKLLTAS